MAKKERLKNGLDSLFEDNFHEDNEAAVSSGVETIRISLIEPDRNQPRKKFDDTALAQLAENIGQHGVLQPILVRKVGDERYMIVAGERRWRAARLAGVTEIPAIVREFSDSETAQIALIENIQREDLTPLEEAEAYKRLSDDFNMTQEEIAKMVGKSRAAISNSVRLLKLCDEVKEGLENGLITTGHAKILCGIDDEETQKLFYKQASDNNMTVRQFEEYITKHNSENKEKSEKKSEKSSADFGDKSYAMLVEAKNSIRDAYGVEPRLKRKANGSIVMEMKFSGDEDFAEFLSRLS